MRGLKQNHHCPHDSHQKVAPHVGAWIETLVKSSKYLLDVVAPHVGAWIETFVSRTTYTSVHSVAPHVGAWIETRSFEAVMSPTTVAPHVGAWIETVYVQDSLQAEKSHLM